MEEDCPVITASRVAVIWQKVEATQVSPWRTDRQMWSIHTMEYYAAPKREEILTHAATWTSPEGIMPSEISQSQRTNAAIPLTRDLRGSRRDRRQMVGAGRGRG